MGKHRQGHWAETCREYRQDGGPWERTKQGIGLLQWLEGLRKEIGKRIFQGEKSLRDAYSFEDLHTDKELLTTINQGSGTYLAQIKGNQKHLLDVCKDIHSSETPDWQESVWEKGHGRIEVRKGHHYRVVPD